MGKEIYDVITKQVILDDNKSFARKISADPSSLSNLRRGKIKMLFERFCLLENKGKLIFVLVDVLTKEEFECLSSATIFKHLNLPYHDNQAKYIYEIRKKRQITASIGGRLLCLKEDLDKTKIEYINRTNSFHLFPEIIEYREKTKQQRVIASLLRKRVLETINKANGVKFKKTMELVGCPIEFLIKYLESKFVDGMSWANRGKERGKWHIDHIRPCCTFDLTLESEQKRCFHYSNLRPLWAEDNLCRPKDGKDVFGYGLDI